MMGMTGAALPAKRDSDMVIAISHHASEMELELLC